PRPFQPSRLAGSRHNRRRCSLGNMFNVSWYIQRSLGLDSCARGRHNPRPTVKNTGQSGWRGRRDLGFLVQEHIRQTRRSKPSGRGSLAENAESQRSGQSQQLCGGGCVDAAGSAKHFYDGGETASKDSPQKPLAGAQQVTGGASAVKQRGWVVS